MREDERGASGAREMLGSLPPDTLIALCQTVTQGLITAHSTDEAMKAIILHSPDWESILRRKVMTRDILFQYLHNKGVSVTSDTVKQGLISKTLSLWLGDDQMLPNTSTELQTVQQEVVQDNRPHSDVQLQTMAQQFVEWFYPLLRECGLHEDNFWDNSEVLIMLNYSNGVSQSNVFSGVAQVLNAFRRLVQAYGVVLAPNVVGGLSAEMDPHGLVLITCSGTVHMQVTCTGIFQQVFALTSDPFSQGDWRIKRSKLDVRLEGSSLGVQGTTSALCDGGGLVVSDHI